MDVEEEQGFDNLPVAEDEQEFDETSADSLAGDFLKNVKPEHKAFVEPYVKEWDAGVTKRFQKIHQEYAPYKTFKSNGIDPEYLSEAVNYYGLLQRPETAKPVFEWLVETYGFENVKKALAEDAAQEAQGVPPEFQQLPPALIEKMNTQEKALNLLMQIVTQDKQADMQRREDAKLEEALTAIQKNTKKYPNYDTSMVLAIQAAYSVANPAFTLEDAASAWEKQVQALKNRASASAPKVVSGAGTPPMSQGINSIGKASSAEIKDAIVQFLSKRE